MKGSWKIDIPLKVAGIYALAGGVWILFSDRALEIMVYDSGVMSRIQTIKGWLYVLVTALLVYCLVRRYLFRIVESEAKVNRLNVELEERVAARTTQYEEANAALKHSLAKLSAAQGELVRAEKMAVLGGLVAGVAHEINTPMGVSLTAASFLEDKTKEMVAGLRGNRLKRSELQAFCEDALWATASILTNIDRAEKLVSSFKQVAVDQTNERIRVFGVRAYLEEILRSLEPQYAGSGHRFRIRCPGSLEIENYPGAFAQVITNLVTNSMIHGFEGVSAGVITIEVSVEGGQLHMNYEDDGRGMDRESVSRVFDPFFTTRRGQGGTGLGMHIVYNIVTQLLGGQIECRSALGGGACFMMRFPLALHALSSGPSTKSLL